MKIISLSSSEAGYACGVRLWMEKNLSMTNQLTGFFDYLITSFDSILQLLEHPNQHFTKQDITIESSLNGFKKHSVVFSKLHKLISIHDLSGNNSKNIDLFLEKWEVLHSSSDLRPFIFIYRAKTMKRRKLA
jgi:hypothetical protein